MITEQARKDVAKTRLDSEIKYLENILKVAPRFERLVADEDFQAWMQDLKDAAEVHKGEILEWANELGLPASDNLSVTDGFFRRLQIMTTIEQHAVRREQLLELVNQPEKIVHAALTARDRLAEIKPKITQEATNA